MGSREVRFGAPLEPGFCGPFDGGNGLGKRWYQSLSAARAGVRRHRTFPQSGLAWLCRHGKPAIHRFALRNGFFTAIPANSQQGVGIWVARIEATQECSSGKSAHATQGFMAVFEAIDTALKAASVEVPAREKLGGGYITVLIKGDVAAVRAAVDAGKAKVEGLGRLIAAHV